jgi:hypothetical protein
MATRALPWRRRPAVSRLPRLVLRARRKFLKLFPGGFQDESYLESERDAKWEAHEAWEERLSDGMYQARLEQGDFGAIASDAIRIESRTNLLTSSEKLAVRDAVRSPEGARAFATGLHDWLYGAGEDAERFQRWCDVAAGLPRRQTRVPTWPLLTVFGFIARPYVHMFLKPRVTRQAALEYGYDFGYETSPNWATYQSLLGFARRIKRDLRDLRPRDMIDVQSFIWVQGSD